MKNQKHLTILASVFLIIYVENVMSEVLFGFH